MQTKQNSESLDQSAHISEFLSAIKTKSDQLANYFIFSFFAFGLFLATFYDTWQIAVGVGGLLLVAYFSAKMFLADLDFYQYVLSAVLGLFMAQFIYQMHGLFEMHFTAFLSSAILITYQKWKLQIPLLAIVIVHHALFAYLQYSGVDGIYFTQLDHMSLQTFLFHIVLVAAIFSVCGLWAYQFKKYSEMHIDLIFKKKEVENMELKRANYELDHFVYSASHDLRAPLNSMLGLIEIVKDETAEEHTLEYLDALKGNAERLDAFICDILDYSRNLRTDIANDPIVYRELLEEIGKNLKFMGDSSRSVDFITVIRGEEPVFSDRSRLNNILNNVISNAIRYQDASKEKPFVRIEIDILVDKTNIEVSDNGIGIPEEAQPKIYDMFYRASNKTLGSGLGLYIVKEALGRLGGRIRVSSAVGVGTTFYIEIPNRHTDK
ncbi:MAG: HAMP domain-containing sensor histidine kinase [Flavobacterium nitrogenifigens]|uniref:histidine kinase n=1 Tax=Flavobacterium nitrogenifigens TaxID=1617283 RepID=A0A521FFN8_9FLAO|nr:HAMP domain-containing sensor histidine kinase [Flavobacterium nitrogenifigens]KAF2339725.1 HAMP domain-containing histidine kinase [Flavobacterium nitrogenifigens]MDQ8014742.1 HAMP domain-containing sensor histidine kinase [Flavobacterium nitrogenifigens]SMO95016.1 Signal transduction histidine kinase [Flavobacterium nitrogenifigens]